MVRESERERERTRKLTRSSTGCKVPDLENQSMYELYCSECNFNSLIMHRQTIHYVLPSCGGIASGVATSWAFVGRMLGACSMYSARCSRNFGGSTALLVKQNMRLQVNDTESDITTIAYSITDLRKSLGPEVYGFALQCRGVSVASSCLCGAPDVVYQTLSRCALACKRPRFIIQYRPVAPNPTT